MKPQTHGSSLSVKGTHAGTTAPPSLRALLPLYRREKGQLACVGSPSSRLGKRPPRPLQPRAASPTRGTHTRAPPCKLGCRSLWPWEITGRGRPARWRKKRRNPVPTTTPGQPHRRQVWGTWGDRPPRRTLVWRADSIDCSKGAALLLMKPRPRGRSSMDGLAPGSPRTRVT